MSQDSACSNPFWSFPVAERLGETGAIAKARNIVTESSQVHSYPAHFLHHVTIQYTIYTYTLYKPVSKKYCQVSTFQPVSVNKANNTVQCTWF